MRTTERITTAEALVRFLIAQQIHDERDDTIRPLIPGVFAIFGHGNALGLGEALHTHRHEIRTIRGQNEQGMALAAVAYAKAARRRQVMAVTTSIGPGALNTVTAAGCAMANRLPLLLLLGDTFQSRMPDPVLQQIERFEDPTVTANDALRPVSRYWDRITSPSQLLATLPQAISVLLDPENTGPVTLALPQDVQVMAYDFPTSFFTPRVHRVTRSGADTSSLMEAARILRNAERPLIVAGGGVHYSLAEGTLAEFALKHRIPVMETVAGKSSLVDSHPLFAGPIGVFADDPGLRIARAPDVVLALGTRLQDFTTESGTVFDSADVQLISVNVSRLDAHKRGGLPVRGDVRRVLMELTEHLGDWTAPEAWTQAAGASRSEQRENIVQRTQPTTKLPAYAEVVRAVNAAAAPQDYVVVSSGGLAGEMVTNWQSLSPASFDCEYGFSTMGYEISGGWGAALERAQSDPSSRVYALAGDGSFMMLPMDVYSAALVGGTRLSLIVCDNEGFNVIERLQLGHGTPSFKTMLADEDHPTPPAIDFVAMAIAMGVPAFAAHNADELRQLLVAHRDLPGAHVYVIKVAAHQWTQSDSFWEVGVPEASPHAAVEEAHRRVDAGKQRQSQLWSV